MYGSVKLQRDHERRVVLLARVIEVRGGDDADGYAACFFAAMVRQAKPEDVAKTIKLAADVDAWRRARRTYRHFFE